MNIGKINNSLGNIVVSFIILLIFSNVCIHWLFSGYLGSALGQGDNKSFGKNVEDGNRFAQFGKKFREVGGEKVPQQYIVVLKEKNVSSTAIKFAAQEAKNQGAVVRHIYEHAMKGYAIRIPSDKVLESILQNPQVDYVQPDRILKSFSQTLPTGINRVDGDLSSTNSGDGSGIVNADIAILDTGIQLNHPDLNVYRDTTFVFGTTNGNDDDGHGTHVAGIAAAMDNTAGVVGIAPGARLWAVKVLDKNGNGFDSDIIAGIDYITQHSNEIDVVNMSFGGDCCDDALHTAIVNSVAAGVTYTAAAGNDGIDASSQIPASYPEVLTVSAIFDTDGKCGAQGGSNDDKFWSSSNYGTVVDIAAPGVNIYSTYTGSSYATMTGTSMATQHVTGSAALYQSLHPGASPSVVKAALLSSGSNPSTVCDGKGHGYFTGDPDNTAEPLLYVGTLGNGDTTPPTLASTDPTNGATNIPLNKWVRATFSEPMLSSSITSSTFTLKVSGSSTNVPGVVWLNTGGDSKNAYFAASSNLSPSTTYIATVTTGVKDLAGNAMTNAQSWSFTTGTTASATAFTTTSNTTSGANLTRAAGVVNDNSSISTSSSRPDLTSISGYTSIYNGSVISIENKSSSNQTFSQYIPPGNPRMPENETNLLQQQQQRQQEDQTVQEQAKLVLQELKKQQLSTDNKNGTNNQLNVITNTTLEKLKLKNDEKDILDDRTAFDDQNISDSRYTKNPSISEKIPTIPAGPQNHAPSAIDDRFQTRTNNRIVAAILLNDIDRDGDKLKIISVFSPTENKGTITINKNGTVTYLPAPDFVGLYTFTYTISDNEGKTDKAKVSIMVKALDINEPDNVAKQSTSSMQKTGEMAGLQIQAEKSSGGHMTEGGLQDKPKSPNNQKESLNQQFSVNRTR